MRSKPKTATSINAYIDELILSVTDYRTAINAMNKNDFAYHIYQYANFISAPLMVLPAMFNYRFNTELTDFLEVVDLMKLSDKYISDSDSYDADAGVIYSSPVCIYLYMTDFWQQALPKLQKDWEVEPSDLIRFIIDTQRRSNYSAGWSYHIADLFYSETEGFDEWRDDIDISALMLIEDRAYRDDMPVDYPQEFLWLKAISMGLYLSTIRAKSHIESELKTAYQSLYKIHKKSADKKIGEALKRKPKSKSTDLPVNLTTNELLILRYEDENDYIKKSVKRVMDRLKI